jgi:hypothetical protein
MVSRKTMPSGAAPVPPKPTVAVSQPYNSMGAPPDPQMPGPSTQAAGEFGLPSGVDQGKPAMRKHGVLNRSEGVNPGRNKTGNFHKQAPHKSNFPAKFSGKK